MSETKRDDTLQGKVVMVTGANAGMGKEIALALAGRGATLVMVSRNAARGEAARAEVHQKTGNQAVELMVADVSSLESVRQLAQQFQTRHAQLHVLVNNAGVTLPKRLETGDRLETVMATNHFGPFLLTNLLMPTLEAGAPSRVVTVSSAAHAMGKMDFDDLQSSRGYNEIRVYNQSKLANVLFTYELARRLAGTGVTANAVEPGFVKTDMKVPFPYSFFSFMRGPVVEGAKPTVFLASSPEVEGMSGKFFSSKGVAVSSSKASYDEVAAKRLWDVSAKLTRLHGDDRTGKE
jgi:NAD(P)-dependent dehydrogenase (short-subunit alcohol dehydrogenase family)